jgi:vacuolar-type H+-ATPase subunit D/Vma8
MVMQRFEKALGLPELSQVAKTLETIDSLLKKLETTRLRSVNTIVENIVRLQAQGGEKGINAFTSAMQFLASTPLEKIEKLASITKDVRETTATLERIVSGLPLESLKNLPLEDIVGEITRAVKKG